MKLKDFDNIRRAELLLPATLEILDKFTYNSPLIGEQSDFMHLANFISLLYAIDIFSSSRTAQMTEDYNEIRDLYDAIIQNTSTLFKDFEFKHPVEIFAAFVYLYRNGYLSYKKNFEYDTSLKDFPLLGGVDVIRGKGVCRSISSMLVDIYDYMGHDATNLTVYSTTNACSKQQKLCDTDAIKSIKSRKFVNFVVKFTDVVKIGNHQIATVKHNGFDFILDPTNDGILNYDKNSRKLYVGNIENYMKVSTFSEIITALTGQAKIRSFDVDRNIKINQEKYKKVYLKTLKNLKNNIGYVQMFYGINSKIYEDIYKLSEEQRGLIGRAFPFVPRKKVKTKDDELVKKLVNYDLEKDLK